MANSPNFITANGDVLYRIVVNEISTSNAFNFSIINVQVQAWSSNSRTTLDYDGECFIKLDGVPVTSSRWTQGQKVISLNSYTILFDGDYTVSHNRYGNKDVNIAAYFVMYDEGNFVVSSSYKSFSVTLTRLHHTPTSLDYVSDLMVGEESSGTISLYATLYNASEDLTHSLVIKDGVSTIVTLTNIVLSNGTNEISLTSEQEAVIISYLNTEGKVKLKATYELVTYYNSNSIGSDTAEGVLKLEIDGYPLVSFRQGKVGINNSDPQTALDVNGDITCDHITTNDPQYVVEDKVLKIYSAFPLYRVENGVLIIIN